MSNVKGNDIDDLFKRASDKYPLRTDSADWDKLSAALDKDPSLIVPPPNAEGDRRRRKRFFWLFLLLPLGGLVYYVGHNLHGTTASAKVTSSQTAPAQPGANSGTTAPAGEGMTHAAPGQKAPAVPGSAPAQQPSAQPGASSAQQSSAQPGSAPAQASAAPNPAAGSLTPAKPASASRTSTFTPAGSTSDAPAGRHPSQPTFIPATPARPGSVDKGLAAKTTTGVGSSRKTPAPSKTTSDKENHVATGDVDKDTRLVTTLGTNDRSTGTHYPELSTLNSRRAPTTEGVALDVTVKANNSPVSAKENNEPAKGKANSVAKNNTKNKKQTFLYGGLIVAPDLSTVKYQSIKGMGTTFGVLLGYQLNRKWAIETGAYYDHKKYYTDGEYFKKETPNPYKLLNVDGSCNMWEIPLNVRYNLSSGEKTKWFATAGLSTYLMTSEKYVSTYTYNGNTWPIPWNNKKPSQYWFSIINLSVGYEQKLGKIGNLRLEPYLRIPLKGMGSGSLPIMSAGLNIGITRRIW